MSKARRRALILFSLILVALFLITVQHQKRSFDFLDFLAYPFHLLNSLTDSLGTGVRHLWSGPEENRQLREMISKLIIERQGFLETIEENKRLREILDIKEHTPSFVAAANVIGRGYDRYLNTVLIDKGRQDGIVKDMAVVSVNGLVGKIFATEPRYSKVLLMKDPNFSVAVRLQTNRYEGVLSGTGHAYGALKYIPRDITVKEGEVLVTSGLDGIFPPGITAGTVHSLRVDTGTFYQDIRVAPAQADAEIEEVIILRMSLHRQKKEGTD